MQYFFQIMKEIHIQYKTLIKLYIYIKRNISTDPKAQPTCNIFGMLCLSTIFSPTCISLLGKWSFWNCLCFLNCWGSQLLYHSVSLFIYTLVLTLLKGGKTRSESLEEETDTWVVQPLPLFLLLGPSGLEKSTLLYSSMR